MRKKTFYEKCLKRFFDFFLSLIALVVLSPILLIIYILSMILLGGNPIFKQYRPGKNGKIFPLYKFRSMTNKKDKNGNLLPDAKRLTKVGTFVRKTSIDELPQLINVLKGDMALIGPRPLLPRYLPFYTERERLRHTVRPGISGWAQVNGRNNITWDNKLECDAYYAEHVSLWLDIKILWLTLYKVVKREGVIVDKAENYLDVERQKRAVNR
jgi:lipopolysaccharide/colanic/teichoic acid biosynthesis glycosyltransferase